MKAVKIMEPGKIEIVEIEKPKIKNQNEVIIKVKRVGICGSDLHIYGGHNPFATYPRVWGHEFVGEVVEVGNVVEKVKTGDHVTVEPIDFCGECYACKQDRGNVCENLQVSGVHVDGGCQEYVSIKEEHVYKLNKNISWDQALLAEPLTIGAQACYRADLQKNDVLLVMGTGTIGLCVLQIAKTYGAKVIMTDIVEEKLEYATTIGADYTINVKKENMQDRVNKITDGMGANVVVDSVCNKESLEQAVDVTSVAGRVVALGFGDISSEITHLSITKKELNILGSRLQTNRFPIVTKLMNEGKLSDLDSFVTQSYDLDEVEAAFNFALENPGKFRKIVVKL